MRDVNVKLFYVDKVDNGLSATHEMHDLQLVAIFERGGWPLCARDNLQVQLNRHAISLHAKVVDERSHRQAIGKITLFTIDLQFHLQND